MSAIAKYRKFVTAAVGCVALVVSYNLVSGSAQSWLVAILAVATALGVYAVPNKPTA